MELKYLIKSHYFDDLINRKINQLKSLLIKKENYCYSTNHIDFIKNITYCVRKFEEQYCSIEKHIEQKDSKLKIDQNKLEEIRMLFVEKVKYYMLEFLLKDENISVLNCLKSIGQSLILNKTNDIHKEVLNHIKEKKIEQIKEDIGYLVTESIEKDNTELHLKQTKLLMIKASDYASVSSMTLFIDLLKKHEKKIEAFQNS